MQYAEVAPEPRNEARDALLDRIVEATPKHVDSGVRPQIESLVRLYFRGVPEQDLESRSVDDLCGAVVTHWTQLQQRRPGELALAVFNPSFEHHGWQSAHTVVQLVTDDQPYLVRTLQAIIARAGHEIHLLVHPILGVGRDDEGRIRTLDAKTRDSELHPESLILVELDRVADEKLDALESTLRDALVLLDTIRAARPAMEETIETIEVPGLADEQRDFVRWLDSRQFACLGIGTFAYRTGEGLSRDGRIELGLFDPAHEDATWTIESLISKETQAGLADVEEPLVLARGNRLAPVVRNEHIELVLLLERDAEAGLTGLVCIGGVFTPGLQNEAIGSTPWLRERFARVIDESDVAADSHDGKALASTLRTFPRDMLLQMPADALRDMAIRIIALHERQQIRLFSSTDALGNFCNCLVYIPRDTYGRDLRLRIQSILTAHIDGHAAGFHTSFSSDSSLARLHFVIHRNPPMDRVVDWPAIENRIRQAAVTWDDRLVSLLHEQYEPVQALALERRYYRGFPSSYREDYSARAALADIGFIEEELKADEPRLGFYRHIVADTGTVSFKLFARANPVFLSNVIPIIENMGLHIEAEHPFEITRRGTDPVWIHEFTVQRTGSARLDARTEAERVREAFGHIWAKDVENDGFNRLILDAGLTWRQIVMLRAYSRYLLQIKTAFSQDYMIDCLVSNHEITALLARYFAARFEPDHDGDGTDALETEIERALDDVDSLDQDRILRTFLNLMRSTLRTNFFLVDERDEPLDYVSFKFDSGAIADLPLPRPWREIFVYSPRVEGIHLRGGKVARGGLRWSDRREDFRTEVLGLMKAQMVKNAVIVPVGSKGGFYVKAALAAERDAAMKTVVACYQTFLKGLLDVTDNIVDGEVVPPANVVRHDDDDPYLVVAADKGTATFSDYANAVSESYGFWLGDAFASGGSAGYDHKKMGITARGAWESVKRHFRQLGQDTQREPFTVVGIGDMAGDVFGNGMLLSEQIRLVAAFNHLHIIIDPDPDPAKGYAERKRLFELPRSQWTDYDESLLSAGGMIVSRQDKKIELSSQARDALGVDKTSFTPTELISAILKAPVDLLWNGGIGTYVKASTETHADAADRANDVLRVNGRDLRCRVVGEGGNLGCTQLGRIEYAGTGGLIYTDAIDNSAGVDCSDHEVNIKILLNGVVTRDDMTRKQRDRLLADMTSDVAHLVLADNYLQTQCIDLTHVGGSAALDEQARFMAHLESTGRLDRDIEFLPDAETIADMLAAERGLSRPQIAVLVSYSKMVMYEALLDAGFADDPSLENVLFGYFPGILGERHADELKRHRLRAEIIATLVTNEFVNRLGPTFAFRMEQELGTTPLAIANAFVAVRSIFRMPALWSSIEKLDNRVPADIQYQMQILVRGLVERATHWLLRVPDRGETIGERVERFEPGITALVEAMPECLAPSNRATLDQRMRFFADAGVPEDTALAVADVVPLSSSLDVVEIAATVEQAVGEVAEVYFVLGHELELQWMRERIGELQVSTQWHTLAKSELRSDLHNQQRELCLEVCRTTDASTPAPRRVASWQRDHGGAISKYASLMTDLKASSSVDFAMLSLGVNEVHKLSRAAALQASS